MICFFIAELSSSLKYRKTTANAKREEKTRTATLLFRDSVVSNNRLVTFPPSFVLVAQTKLT